MPMKEIVAPDTAAKRNHGAVSTCRAKGAEQHVLDHLRRRLGPTLVFIGAHVFAAGPVDDVVFAVKMGSVERAHEDRHGIDVTGRGVGRIVVGNGELVVLARASGATASETGT